tara:strand:+ start:1161 stop:1520 length:360 start_codon:yes stop_codon:yes gene_type:complete
MSSKNNSIRRQSRVRWELKQKSKGRLRLTVFRSNQHIYAQVVDDNLGKTLVAASTIEKDLREKEKNKSKQEQAAVVGQMIAERAKVAGINEVVFDRGRYLYHGRVKFLAEAARESGLAF